MLTLYHCDNSVASQKVRLYLAEKTLPWKSILIDLLNQAHLTSNYRNINPKALVPALQDEQGMIHCGSTEIIRYLESLYPDPCLVPLNNEEIKLVYNICKQHEILHDPYLRTLSYHNLFFNTKNREAINVSRVLELAASHPDRARGEFLRRVIQQEFTQSELDDCRKNIKMALDNIEQYLKQGDGNFIVGEYYSIADVVCCVSVWRIEQLKLTNLINQHPMVKDWYNIMQQRPSFEKAILSFITK